MHRYAVLYHWTCFCYAIRPGLLACFLMELFYKSSMGQVLSFSINYWFGNLSVKHKNALNRIVTLHSQKRKDIIVPLGVQWLVTGAVPSRVQFLYPWQRVQICTLAICTLRDQFCTSGDNFVPLFNSTNMDPSKRVQNWL